MIDLYDVSTQYTELVGGEWPRQHMGDVDHPNSLERSCHLHSPKTAGPRHHTHGWSYDNSPYRGSALPQQFPSSLKALRLRLATMSPPIAVPSFSSRPATLGTSWMPRRSCGR